MLLEEPQAAVYAWLAATGERWRRRLSVGDTLLVCDVGGGTTDLTLVGAAEEQGELVLRRIAVGNHLLVGGDNMDLALAHYVAGRFAEKGVAARSLAVGGPVAFVPGGQRDAACARRARNPQHFGPRPRPKADRRHGFCAGRSSERERVAGRGLFPPLPTRRDRPRRQRVSGFREMGLPFESDTAVTRHLAAFLQAHGDGRHTGPSDARAFQWRRVQGRRAEAAAAGRDGRVVRRRRRHRGFLEGEHDLDHAVARGAAYYGWAKQRGGMRIRGGTARGYYVGIETAGLAVPGGAALRALCVVPIGMEEGTETDVPSDEIGLVVGEPAHFRFFSSSVRKHDRPGDVLAAWTPTNLRRPIRWRPRCRPTNRSTNPTFLSVFRRGLPS